MLNLTSLTAADQPERRNTISAKALVELREAIVTARIKPGAGLSETDVAQAMNISRTPVREAFARLFEEGLIEISPQTGTRVSLIDMARVREATFIRSTLESAVIAHAELEPQSGIIDELEMLLRQQERSRDNNDMVALHRADMAFHSGLMNAFRMPRAWTACQHVSADMIRVQFLIGMRPDHIEAIVSEHRGILDSIRDKDFAQASALLAAHIGKVDLDQNDLRALNAEYFRNAEGQA